jgi:hypothetical protein
MLMADFDSDTDTLLHCNVFLLMTTTSLFKKLYVIKNSWKCDCRPKILLRLFLADVKSYSTFDILGRIVMAIFATLKLGFTPM